MNILAIPGIAIEEIRDSMVDAPGKVIDMGNKEQSQAVLIVQTGHHEFIFQIYKMVNC